MSRARTDPAAAPRVRGPLRPVELATAAVMGAATVVLAVLGSVVPIAAALQVLAVVPLGVVAQRHRPRALLTAAVAAGSVGFLVAGTAPLVSVGLAALLGGIVGETKRRGRGAGTAALGFALAGPGVALLTIGLLLVFSNLRELTLLALRNTVRGMTGTLGQLPGLGGGADRVQAVTDTLVANWWWPVGISVAFSTVLTGTVAWFVLGRVLDRLDALPVEDRLDGALAGDGAPAPLPVALEHVAYRYPGAERDALRGVDLELWGPELVAVVGDNGSGKSTVVRVLAGRAPTGGTVHRAGPPGLGLVGGTALVSQRPESQVLGVLVRDDVVWGLPAGAGPRTPAEVEALLAEVGLAGYGARSTTTLSGGELQRLAVAASLARSPRLLLSDESTAMLDPAGRAALVGVLERLPARGVAVVHVTHRPEDTTRADRVVTVEAGRVRSVTAPGPAAEPRDDPAPRRAARGGAPVLSLRGVGHVYDARTPWAHRALTGVDLDVAAGEAVLLAGGNGSGKSTLAWVLAGLTRPTEGEALLDGRPVADQVGSVALAFQHARLQLQRPTVGEDVAAAAGVASAADRAVAGALGMVGLPASLAARGTDGLSGGQLRRVALAGLLVGRPRVVVLDEPLAGLDAPSRAGLVELLGRLRERWGTTLVVISHDLGELAQMCDRTVHVAGGRVVGDAAAAPVGAVLR
ncbi:ATP-binding cassette domain-containing protein [Rhodococcus aerolatus]